MFITNPKAHITAGGGINAADAAPGTDLKPEMTNALEAGFEWRFFGDRLGINATYYKTNTHNQFFKLPALSAKPMLSGTKMPATSRTRASRCR